MGLAAKSLCVRRAPKRLPVLLPATLVIAQSPIMKILILPGDGIGPEIVGQAVRVLEKFKAEGAPIELSHGLLGGAAHDAHGHPYPEVTQQQARAAEAILLGCVGGPQYDTLPRAVRPEQGLLGIRKDL